MPTTSRTAPTPARMRRSACRSTPGGYPWLRGAALGPGLGRRASETPRGRVSPCRGAWRPGPGRPGRSHGRSSSRRWSSAAATSAWPITPARSAPCAAAVTSGSPPAWPTSSTGSPWPPTTASSAWSLTTWPWMGASPRRRAAARSPAQARSTAASAVASGRWWWRAAASAWRCSRGGQPPRRRPAGRHAQHSGGGWSAARAADRAASGRRLRLPALIPGACSPWAGRPGRHAWGACAGPGWSQVGGGALACLVERVRQAALVHRAATGAWRFGSRWPVVVIIARSS